MTSAEQPGASGDSSARSGQLQNDISRDLYREAVGVVTGMQDDVDPKYSMRKFLEDAISRYCTELEREYNQGQRWSQATTLKRGGFNPTARTAGEVEQLQSWIAPSIRGRCYGAVNGMKLRTPTYTLRDFLESAIDRHSSALKREHATARWIPLDRLRRGRRGSNIPME
ncbi:hypothetical protein [Nocardia pseudovaccinii]|uniref:hypothetical protein n=1 Tax=Nocardia pseudovaccinii TaxID=189540 RepID=UPI0012F4DA89|nr:hypothetical protein [Nocardia pseudovaccinii]